MLLWPRSCRNTSDEVSHRAIQLGRPARMAMHEPEPRRLREPDSDDSTTEIEYTSFLEVCLLAETVDDFRRLSRTREAGI